MEQVARIELANCVWWMLQDLNLWPTACRAVALPSELNILIKINIGMKTLLLSLFLLLPTAVVAGIDNWTEEQRKWYAASTVLTIADWATTRDMTRRYHEGYHETNPILGRYPSRQRVDQHFLTVLIAHYLIADNLSSRNRTVYLQVFTVGQAAVVSNNLNIGLRIRF
jgi:hypothetical protein